MIIGVSVVERLAMVVLLLVFRRGEVDAVTVIIVVVVVNVVVVAVVDVDVVVVVVVDVDGVRRLGSKHTESLMQPGLVPHMSTGRLGVFISATI